MDITRVFDVQATFRDTADTFSGTISIDVTAGSVKAINIPLAVPFVGPTFTFTEVMRSFPTAGRWHVSSEVPNENVRIDLMFSTPLAGIGKPGTLVGFRFGAAGGNVVVAPLEHAFLGRITPSLSSPAGDLFLIADHDTTRTVIAPQIENATLQTSQVIAVVGSNVAFDGAADFNNDGLSDPLAHTDAGGCELYLLIK